MILQVEQRRRQKKLHYQMIISEDEFGSCLQTVAVFLYWKFCPFCNFIPGLKQFLLARQVAGKGQCSLFQTGLLHLCFLQQQIYGHTKNAEAGGEIRSMGGSQTSLGLLSTLWYILPQSMKSFIDSMKSFMNYAHARLTLILTPMGACLLLNKGMCQQIISEWSGLVKASWPQQLQIS